MEMKFLKILLQIFVIYSLTTITNTTRHRIKSKLLSVISLLQGTILEGIVGKAAYTSDVKFYCRNSHNGPPFSLRLNDIRAARKLDLQLPLGFLLHGWMDEGGASWLDDVQLSWIKYKRGNVCVVDWKIFARRDYKSAVMRTFDVGRTLADIIKFLELYGFHRDNVTIVGFSLGAHAAGYAGSLLNGEINEIIGLDPAGPLFTVPVDIGIKYRLDKSDAKFVQVMHTSGGTLGTHAKCGHADFYPNGGVSPQSNCRYADNMNEDKKRKHPVGCSHSIVLQYFKDSMDPEKAVEGVQCSSYRLFLFGFCNANRRCRFGFHSERIPGNYFYTTEPDIRHRLRFNNKKLFKKINKKKFKI